ncbi:hypothetical protein H7200_02995 [Candidatus Saccharibacteria bacterium]|nr:hypothetical protein [Candidatus Saccharibacteria bacterium]
MSEKQTPSSKDEFNLRQAAEASRNIGLFVKAQEFEENHPVIANVLKLGAIASIIGGGAAAVGELTQPTAAQQAAYEHQNLTDAEATSYKDSISKAINAMYDSKAKIGEIDIALGDSLLDPSVNAVIAHIGEDAYHQRQSQIYDALKNSTLRFNPQPGEKYAVVETDIDPAVNNGIEFITVDISHVLASEGTKIPAPNTH